VTVAAIRKDAAQYMYNEYMDFEGLFFITLVATPTVGLHIPIGKDLFTFEILSGATHHFSADPFFHMLAICNI